MMSCQIYHRPGQISVTAYFIPQMCTLVFMNMEEARKELPWTEQHLDKTWPGKVYQHQALNRTGLEELKDGMMKFMISIQLLLMDGNQGKSAFIASTDKIFKFSNESVIGHYTQFVWGQSYQMGCGILISEQENYKFHYLVCNYYPSGNVLDAPVYLQGEPCSECPEGTVCRDNLCARVWKSAWKTKCFVYSV